MCSRKTLESVRVWNIHLVLLRIAQSWPSSQIIKEVAFFQLKRSYNPLKLNFDSSEADKQLECLLAIL